jgi:hypothetical protein
VKTLSIQEREESENTSKGTAVPFPRILTFPAKK